MVGFRNVAVHDYRELDAGIVDWVINQGFGDLLTLGGRGEEGIGRVRQPAGQGRVASRAVWTVFRSNSPPLVDDKSLVSDH